MNSSRVVRLGLVLLGLAACSPEPAARELPEGTVLVLGAVPIARDEVEAATAAIAAVRPQETRPQHLRVALTRVVFPIAAGRAIAPGARERMRAMAESERNARVQGRASELALGPAEVELDGTWYDLGPVLGPVALALPVGEWSAVTEAPGAWVILKVEQRSQATRPTESHMRVRAVHFDFVSGGEYAQEIVQWLDAAKLEIVDRTYGDVLPEWWRHRLRAGGGE
jgi:hypothetical protein